MRVFDASHAWDIGFWMAVRGILHMPDGTWLSKFARDWKDGYQQAIKDGKWGTNNGN